MSIAVDVRFENNPEKVINSGQLLRGTVHLVLTEPKNVRGVFIKIKGEARVRWRHGRNSCDTTGSQDYLNEKTYLVGGERGEIQLAAGSYHYSFQSALPVELPSSFEGEFGKMRYKTCVVLDIPMWKDKEFEDPFTVIKTVNLNDSNPSQREPVVGELDRKFFKFGFLICCRSEPLSINARLPGGGRYVPGQTIYVNLEVDNRSDQDVTAFTVQLISDITYYTRVNTCFKQVKSETIILTETATYACGINEKKTFHPCLIVPQTPPSDDSEDNLIQIRHFCRITGNVAFFHFNPMIKLPVTIGTIPMLEAPYTEPSTMDGVFQNPKSAFQPNDSSAPLLFKLQNI